MKKIAKSIRYKLLLKNQKEINPLFLKVALLLMKKNLENCVKKKVSFPLKKLINYYLL